MKRINLRAELKILTLASIFIALAGCGGSTGEPTGSGIDSGSESPVPTVTPSNDNSADPGSDSGGESPVPTVTPNNDNSVDPGSDSGSESPVPTATPNNDNSADPGSDSGPTATPDAEDPTVLEILSVSSDQSVTEGDSVYLSVSAVGEQLRYQWYFNDAMIPGAEESSLTISDIVEAEDGAYYVLVSDDNNPSGIPSSTIQVSVLPSETDIAEFGSSLDILVLGSSSALCGTSFEPTQIASELSSLLTNDAAVTLPISVVMEDVYAVDSEIIGSWSGYSSAPWTEYEMPHYRHSLMQYYHWPQEKAERIANLKGEADNDWDFVVILGDACIISDIPGYWALGVNTVANSVVEGGAQPLLLMQWPASSNQTSIDHFIEFTYRVSDQADLKDGDGIAVDLPVIPAGIAWESYQNKDISFDHPSPKGAYLSAAAIYAQILNKNPSSSTYAPAGSEDIAEHVWNVKSEAASGNHYSGPVTFTSAFRSLDIEDVAISINHTGTSTERGIRRAIDNVFPRVCAAISGATGETECYQTSSPSGALYSFNYGRANTNYEKDKQYRVSPSEFKSALGFPMHDDGTQWSNTIDRNRTMLSGLDKRYDFGVESSTDLGVARFMAKPANQIESSTKEIDSACESELACGARAIPTRTLFAQMYDLNPNLSAYAGDNSHMNDKLHLSVAAYMFTIVTGRCAMDAEPSIGSSAWYDWKYREIGHKTAWTLSNMGPKDACAL